MLKLRLDELLFDSLTRVHFKRSSSIAQWIVSDSARLFGFHIISRQVVIIMINTAFIIGYYNYFNRSHIKDKWVKTTPKNNLTSMTKMGGREEQSSKPIVIRHK